MSRPSGPTRFPELNGVLAELVRRAREVLGPDFVGAYLQGSFALGDADEFSDCDFLIPVRRRPTPEQEAGLRALHDELPARDGHWNRHLEGSYPVADELRSLAGLERHWLFVDHGSRAMEWSDHCNNEVARWSLREHGVPLSGPSPDTVVDEVPGRALRSRMRRTIPSFDADFATWMTLDIGWGQRYAVASYCRMLYTLETAEVCSKQTALVWAMARLDARWVPLLVQVLVDRPRGYSPDDPARPGSADRTRAFAAYARELAAAW